MNMPQVSWEREKDIMNIKHTGRGNCRTALTTMHCSFVLPNCWHYACTILLSALQMYQEVKTMTDKGRVAFRRTLHGHMQSLGHPVCQRYADNTPLNAGLPTAWREACLCCSYGATFWGSCILQRYICRRFLNPLLQSRKYHSVVSHASIEALFHHKL